MGTRIGVDVGGTFTDVVVADDQTGEIRIGKVPTRPDRPDEGVLHSLTTVFEQDAGPSGEYFVHGTTVGLNALLERAGAKVGLLSTDGFRDVLEIRRGDRTDPYDLFAPPIAPLVPRRLRLPVRERMRSDGTVHEELCLDDVAAALRVFADEGVECVAVAYINSYANPEHELRTAEELRRLGYAGEITLSHQVSGEYREYERTSTTVVDAYIRPSVRQYLARLERSLRDARLDADLLITRPDGGALTFGEAEDRPFETILSGPVGGVQGAAELARQFDLGTVITADVGGTSFDTALVIDGASELMYEGRILDMPLQTAWVDVRSIGAGGGSIAHVDAGGLLRVGPRSARAKPGPACYGRGGVEPTVTDAACVLGMLPEQLASGLVLSGERAEAAVRTVAGPLGMTVQETARGILVIAAAAMSGAMREITIEQGHDPRTATLMPFGGAGPLFGTLLAGELGIRDVVVPPYAGNFSAWGMLGADLVRSATRSRVMALDDDTLPKVDETLAELFERLDGDGSSARVKVREIGLDMRYRGQDHTITVQVRGADGRVDQSVEEITEQFQEAYRRAFAHNLNNPPEIVTVRATLREQLGARRAGSTEQRSDTTPGTRRAFSFTVDDWLEFTTVERTAMEPGRPLPGPAIVVDPGCTIYVDAGYEVSVNETGVLRMRDVRAHAGDAL